MGLEKYFAKKYDWGVKNPDDYDKKFVEDLIANKEEAWLFLIEFCEGMLGRHKKHLEDFSLTIGDLFNETVIYLMDNDCQRLRAFRNREGSFIGFIYNQFRAVKKKMLYKYNRDRQSGMSDEREFDTLIEQEGNTQCEKSRQMDMRETINQAFFLLWESNTQRANVYLMREKLDMPSKQVAAFLGLTVSNVDATLKRAKLELKNILSEMGYDYGNLFY